MYGNAKTVFPQLVTSKPHGILYGFGAIHERFNYFLHILT